MNNDFKNFVDPLSHKMVKLTFEFLQELLEEKISDNEIMNLVVSSYMSSLFCCMRIISSEVPEFKNDVEKFIKNIKEILDLLPKQKYEQ